MLCSTQHVLQPLRVISWSSDSVGALFPLSVFIIYGSRMRAPLSQSSAFQRLVGTHTSHEPGQVLTQVVLSHVSSWQPVARPTSFSRFAWSTVVPEFSDPQGSHSDQLVNNLPPFTSAQVVCAPWQHQHKRYFKYGVSGCERTVLRSASGATVGLRNTGAHLCQGRQ